MPELSIIITVYNKAAFVEKCLQSCLEQHASPDSYEVIAVNDGSTDASLQLLQQYAAKDSRLKVIDQENAGLSLARERGAAAASGTYLWFVDADDSIAPESVRLLSACLGGKPDVVSMQAQTLGNPEIRNELPADLCSGTALLSIGEFDDCVPFYLFRKSFLQENALHFYPKLLHEDSEFTPRVLYAASSLAVCPHVLYYVYPDPRSLARLPKIRQPYDLVTVAESLYAFRKTHAMDSVLQAVFAHRISKALNFALNVICKFGRKEQKEFNAYLYAHRDVLDELSRSLFKYRLEYRLFRLFPRHNVEVYRLMKRC